MGYFANGTEGMAYESRFCDKCVHQEDCTILLLHAIHNYEECNKKDSMLHTLIPMDKHGNNERCTMFIEEGKTRDMKKDFPNRCGLCKESFADMLDYTNHMETCK